MKFIVNEERESWYYLMLYMAAGWLSPLLVLIVTVPVNYAIPGAVGYGVDGLCWMSQTLAIIISVIVPLGICINILPSTGAFAFVCFILLKIRRSQESKELKNQTGSCDFRVLVAGVLYFRSNMGIWIPCSNRHHPILDMVYTSSSYSTPLKQCS